MDKITVTRTSTESKMEVSLDFSPLASDYRTKIKTPITFLNHMIEHVAWRSGINIETSITLDEFALSHVVCEDLGIAFGKAVLECVKRSTPEGIKGYADAYGIIDEARAHSLISFEDRSYFDIDYTGGKPAHEVEGMYSEDLETFLLGFSQGANCTLQIVLEKGENGHHIWEAIFRSLGTALGEALKINPELKGRTAGVAGAINWEIK